MGPNHFFLGFVKNTLRESSEGWAYITSIFYPPQDCIKIKRYSPEMVGENLGKGYVFIFVLIGSKCHSWTWHPLFITFEASLGNPFVSHSIYYKVSPCLNQCCQIIGRVVHMFKRSSSEASIESAICSCPFSPCWPFLCPVQLTSYSISPSKYVTHFVSLMGDTSRCSCDEFFPIDSNSLSRNKT